MKEIKKIAKGAGKVILVLLIGVLMPILIWVALGVAINLKLHEKRVKQTTAPTIGELLNKAGLTIHR